MLVEDSPTVRAVLGDALSRAGFDVDGARDADDAMDLLLDRRYDAVIADYQLPGMTGLDFLAALRGAYPQAPLILYSGWMTPELAAEARAFGVTAVLEKPVPLDRLMEVVRTALAPGGRLSPEPPSGEEV